MRKLFSIKADVLGDGKVTFEWSQRGNYLAATGSKRKAVIYDRSGALYDEVHFPPAEVTPETRGSAAAQLQWDPSSDLLAILPNGCPFIMLWSPNKEVQRVEIDFKGQEVSVVSWSKKGSILAVGTAKGNLLLYNAKERKKTPIMGKHTKRIQCACWNKENNLAMAGADKMVTVSDGVTGETQKTFYIKQEPYELHVSDKKEDTAYKRQENTYTINVGRKTLYLIQMNKDLEKEKPLELAFQEYYGNIMKHLWFGDGYIMLAFKAGYIVVVSSHSKELSEEIHSGKYLDLLTDMAFCPALNRVALGGGTSVKVVDCGAEYNELKADAVELDPGQAVEKLGWTPDGQVLTVGTDGGLITAYLASLPTVYDSFQTKVVYLTSLSEVSVVDISVRTTPLKIQLATEPAFCGIGPQHVAAGINNQVWFYRISNDTDSKLVSQRSYLSSVQSIKLNDNYAAILAEGRVIVHPIEVDDGRPDDHDKVLPPQGTMQVLTCCSITPHFVVTGSQDGKISYYLVDSLHQVNEYRGDSGAVTKIFPQPLGSKLVYEDENKNVYMFNPVNDVCLPLPQYSGSVETVLWDMADTNLFAVLDGTSCFTFLYQPLGITGPTIKALGQQAVPKTHTVLVLRNGVLGCRLKNGALDSLVLESHRSLQPGEQNTKNLHLRQFTQLLKLGQLKGAWDCAVTLKSTDTWQQLAVAALEQLDLELAIAAYRQLGNASMVLSLENLQQHEDRHLLSAHILVLLERDYNAAQEMFLRSSTPRAALEMRVDLKHWQEALRLAQQMDPAAVPLICKEQAQLMEIMGDYQQARAYYQQGLQAAGPNGDGVTLACQCGIARTTLQIGDIRQGRALALQIGTPQLCKECGAILEGMSQLQEAAELYEKAGLFEKAATIYIQTKNFAAATPLMAKVTSTKLLLQYAKAKEAEGRFADAAQAFETAGDVNNVVRLCLEKLNQPSKAYTLVRKSRHAEAGTVVAKYCLQNSNFQGAVEFLLIAGSKDQAFDIAQAHQEMDTFAKIIAAEATPDQYTKIAGYYETRGEYEKAADIYVLASQSMKAVQLFLKVNTVSAVEKAIQVVQDTHSEQLGLLVLDYVMDAMDGAERDELRFKLNIALGRYTEAARDALEMARFDQEEGNYKVAHTKLFATYQQLEELNAKPSSELVRALMLIHSYILVKSLIAINDHTNAARMLVRVARNISKFPRHIVPILTSTVIECQRAGLKKTAFEYASMLMRPEYRNDVAQKYKKKIELMVRKPDKAEEPEEAYTQCPFCSEPGPETEMQCATCQNIIPFDIGTGMRMTMADWAQCPCCRFPCSAQQFIRIISTEQRCPLCCAEVDLSAIQRVADPLADLTKAPAQAGLP